MGRCPRLPQPPLELLRPCNVSSFLHISAFCMCFTDSGTKVIILSRQNVNFWVEHGSTPPPPPTPLRAPQTVQCLKLFAYICVLYVFYRLACQNDHSVETKRQLLNEFGSTPPPPPTPLRAPQTVQCLELFAYIGVLYVFYQLIPQSDHSVETKRQLLGRTWVDAPASPNPP